MADRKVSDKQLIEALLRERDELYRRAVKAERLCGQLSDANTMRQSYEARIRQMEADHQKQVSDMEADHQKQVGDMEAGYQKRVSDMEAGYQKLLALSEDNYYVFKVADKDHKGEAFYDNTNSGGDFHRGVTEMPGAKIDPSPDNNIYILVGACLSLEQQVMTTAHEAYGHGYLYDITGSFIAASHKFVPGVRMEWDKELNKESYMLIRVDTNKTLADRINIVVNQAKYNYEKRIK